MLGLDDVAAVPEEPETGATFEENAVAKAEQAARETGEISLADDSGLAVDALNGMPGVLSARWSGRHGDDAGEHRAAAGPARRRARRTPRRGLRLRAGAGRARAARCGVMRGEWRGRILREPAGSNGFGYDPVFVPAESDAAGDGRTSAELAPAEKDALSHRGRALAMMLPELDRRCCRDAG